VEWMKGIYAHKSREGNRRKEGEGRTIRETGNQHRSVMLTDNYNLRTDITHNTHNKKNMRVQTILTVKIITIYLKIILST
jgi:hypothetical protein